MNRLPPKNDYEKKVLENVEEFGWHCTSVSPEKDKESPRFSYTVGLHTSYQFPEFIIFGLDSKVSHSILTGLAEAAEAGEMYKLNEPCDSLIEGYQCVFVEVPKNLYNDYVFSALWYYSGNSFPLYQVVWPDREGSFPWHSSYINEKGYEQPVLGAHLA
jgi:hypothetical protein